MNTFYVLLPIFIASIGLIECSPLSNTTDVKAGLRYATYCYYCDRCPTPFYSSSPYVSTMNTYSGWCAKASYSSQPGATASRSSADVGFCRYNGCEWRGNQFICCCDRSYCNTASGKSYSILAVVGTALLMFFRL